jgi:hypothetical protein
VISGSGHPTINLTPWDSSQGSMLMLALVRTPDLHDQAGVSDLRLRPSHNLTSL